MPSKTARNSNSSSGHHNGKLLPRVTLLILPFCLIVIHFFMTSENIFSNFKTHFLRHDNAFFNNVVSTSIIMRDEEYNPWHDHLLSNNTNWNNVQYHSGVFAPAQDHSWAEKQILDQCERLTGFTYMLHGYPVGNKSDVCSGPLATNTTCCYCHFSRDGEKLVFAHNYLYWSCAVPRNNSLLPLNSTRIVDAIFNHPKGNRSDVKVAWVTGKFAFNNSYQKEVQNFCQEVREMNLLDPQNIHCYWESPEYALQNRKFRRHMQYRTDPNDVSVRGGGYWFHKSVLLQHHLDQYQYGDFLIYTDLDRIDFFRLGSLPAVLETMAKRPDDDLCIEVIGNTIEHIYAKEDVLTAFNASTYMRDSPEVVANVIILRNSPRMKMFIDAWVECMADWHMVSDEPSVLPNAEGYYEHRHDQTLLSLLIKQFMTVSAVVGPPARSYHRISETVTYRFHDDDGTEPTCPFASFYAARYTANTNNRTVSKP